MRIARITPTTCSLPNDNNSVNQWDRNFWQYLKKSAIEHTLRKTGNGIAGGPNLAAFPY
jgi:hypothetical protein